MAQQSKTIIDLETRFWQSMVDKDAASAKALIAEECLITGPQGSMLIDPAAYEAMTEQGNWSLETFSFSAIQVIFPKDDTAVIAYTVNQRGDMDGRPMDLTCADATTWVSDGSAWKCVLHTETIMEDRSR
ncbi:DUF4440 domain-containing protein [Altererythrobacter xixiisoli]|uniref:DUF4440 domain-containing protein n=1 Tax=Croceibacterium xixiisoli TaxID=1476466 RepID=A0A6I4TVW4_9SPHN|nr:nuclear transport factor 2 family protein [Croceibacterium xixiisoli]MXO99349.1 DUF4440 domain-containing protein [Croceibacterium xixiisoli]